MCITGLERIAGVVVPRALGFGDRERDGAAARALVAAPIEAARQWRWAHQGPRPLATTCTVPCRGGLRRGAEPTPCPKLCDEVRDQLTSSGTSVEVADGGRGSEGQPRGNPHRRIVACLMFDAFELLQRPVTAHGLSNGKGAMIFVERSLPYAAWPARGNLVSPGSPRAACRHHADASARTAAYRGRSRWCAAGVWTSRRGRGRPRLQLVVGQPTLLNQSIGSLALSEACAWDCVHRADLCALRKVC
eukprot:scaffold65977_cov75-Phaeocystis_antarctica.AAC.2